MKLQFPAHFRPGNEDFKALWAECIIAVDANVLLNLYRYSIEARTLLEETLKSFSDRLFLPNQVAKEFLKNRLVVTASQADEYNRAISAINEIETQLTNKKRHPFLLDEHLPDFQSQVEKVITQLKLQKDTLLKRLIDDEILEFVSNIFDNKTGNPFGLEKLDELVIEGDKRFTNQQPPGYKDSKKDSDGDKYRKYGDLIIWKQLIEEAKINSKPIIFVTDDNKDDWWLVQSGRTIGPRTELREEFLTLVGKNFWMYSVDRFIEEAGLARNASVSQEVIEEIKQVSTDTKEDKAFFFGSYSLKVISREMMLDKLDASEKWSQANQREFIGLTSFVKNYLGNMGYDYSTSFDLLRQLEEEGLVEVYDKYSPGFERPTKAIRRVREGAYINRPLKDLGAMLEDSQSS